MTKECQNDEGRIAAPVAVRHSGFVINSSFVIRASSFGAGAFTIVELLVVITIIIVLAGLILATTGYVQKKGSRSRAETEIAAMSAALESYKADNGTYPRDTATLTTENLDARTSGDPSTYRTASRFLYDELFGSTNGGRTPTAGKKSAR